MVDSTRCSYFVYIGILVVTIATIYAEEAENTGRQQLALPSSTRRELYKSKELDICDQLTKICSQKKRRPRTLEESYIENKSLPLSIADKHFRGNYERSNDELPSSWMKKRSENSKAVPRHFFKKSKIPSTFLKRTIEGEENREREALCQQICMQVIEKRTQKDNTYY